MTLTMIRNRPAERMLSAADGPMPFGAPRMTP
jgi:hypothetical protein